MTPSELARFIDHTSLKPETTSKQIDKLCQEALHHEFACVCVNPVFLPQVVPLIQGSPVKVCTVIGFPLGCMSTQVKIFEAEDALQKGANEIDMVLWIGGLKEGKDALVHKDIEAVARVCSAQKGILKVILECALLTNDEKRRACNLCADAGANFVKTSTGFSSGGATVSDVKLLSDIVRQMGLGVKAAGGIRTHLDAMQMINAGATRIGTSTSTKIMEEAETYLLEK